MVVSLPADGEQVDLLYTYGALEVCHTVHDVRGECAYRLIVVDSGFKKSGLTAGLTLFALVEPSVDGSQMD